MGNACCARTPEWVVGSVDTPAGPVPRVATGWSRSDYWGQAKSRISAFRMQYAVDPGLYAVGEPDDTSDVLVSANYKLSFDMLRGALQGRNVWILVLDTRGINVWCAAGKGTFGTDELLRRIREVELDKVVGHRRIVVPQLGAVGVSAHRVKQESDFKVHFGPVHARDLPAYLDAGHQATRAMRTVGFTLVDRLVLTPMEILPAMKRFPIYALVVLALFGLAPKGMVLQGLWSGGVPLLILGALSLLAGAFVTPAVLPWVPFRSFAVKGWIVGLFLVGVSMTLIPFLNPGRLLLLVFAYVFFPAVSSYVALQFTGSTPYTGRSGVEKELRIGVPVYGMVLMVSVGVLIVYELKEWGVL